MLCREIEEVEGNVDAGTLLLTQSPHVGSLENPIWSPGSHSCPARE
jgi:hypothetical protein